MSSQRIVRYGLEFILKRLKFVFFEKFTVYETISKTLLQLCVLFVAFFLRNKKIFQAVSFAP